MDVDEIVRARRRQQALDALDFEHGRETAVRAQLAEVLTELEGSRIDDGAFARMAPEDVALVREVLDPEGDVPEDELEFEGVLPPESPARIRRGLEAERVRLGEVIAASQSCQQALERYIEALDVKEDLPVTAQTPPD